MLVEIKKRGSCYDKPDEEAWSVEKLTSFLNQRKG